MRHPGVTVMFGAALLFGAAGAHADETGPTNEPSRSPEPPQSEHWYGYQTLIVDGVALATLPAGIAVTAKEASSDGSVVTGLTLAGLGGTAYLFGAPIVHFAHGRVGIGFLSLGLRLLAPVAGVGMGALGSEIASGSKNQIGIPIGAAVGAVAAMVVDSAVFGWEKRTEDRSATTRFVPALVVTKQAVGLGLTSSF